MCPAKPTPPPANPDRSEDSDRSEHSGNSEEAERPEYPQDIAVIGDLTESESSICEKLLEVPPGGTCTLFINCPGGSAYAAISLVSIVRLRGLQATGVVSGECSSAALWLLAACQRRLVTAYSVLLFHPMKWQSEEHVQLPEAAEWARHFGQLESEMDQLLAELLEIDLQKLTDWLRPGRYVSGREFAAAGLAELIELDAHALQPEDDERS
jgi:ATP-dependent protease ClpP protease subunit